MMEKVSIHILQGDVRISAGSEVDLHYRLSSVNRRQKSIAYGDNLTRYLFSNSVGWNLKLVSPKRKVSIAYYTVEYQSFCAVTNSPSPTRECRRAILVFIQGVERQRVWWEPFRTRKWAGGPK